MTKMEAVSYLNQYFLPQSSGFTNSTFDTKGELVISETYRRELNEERILDSYDGWTLVGETGSPTTTPVSPGYFMGVTPFKKLESPRVTHHERASYYFRDVTSIIIHHSTSQGTFEVIVRNKDGVTPGSRLIPGSNNRRPMDLITDRSKAYAMASAFAALSPQIQNLIHAPTNTSPQRCSAVGS
jgi:hypothetical protein